MPRKSREQITRLMEIMLLLQKSQNATAAELAQRFKVTERTIYRDMQLLVSRLPISATVGVSGGYRLESDIALDPAIFSNGSSVLLALTGDGMISLLSEAGEDRAHEMMSEAMQRLPPSVKLYLKKARARFLVDSQEWYWKEPRARFLPALKAAIMKGNECEITYLERKMEQPCRSFVQPLGLVWKGGSWYLVSREKGSRRVVRIRLGRILSVTVTKNSFIYPQDFKLDAWLLHLPL